MKTGISKAWVWVEHDRLVLRYNVLLIYFPLYSSLSVCHSFLTAGNDCLALLSRCQDLSVRFEHRAKSNVCSARPRTWVRAWNATLGCAGRAAPAQKLLAAWQTPLHNPSGQQCLGNHGSVCRAYLENFMSFSSHRHFLGCTQQQLAFVFKSCMTIFMFSREFIF